MGRRIGSRHAQGGIASGQQKDDCVGGRLTIVLLTSFAKKPACGLALSMGLTHRLSARYCPPQAHQIPALSISPADRALALPFQTPSSWHDHASASPDV